MSASAHGVMSYWEGSEGLEEPLSQVQMERFNLGQQKQEQHRRAVTAAAGARRPSLGSVVGTRAGRGSGDGGRAAAVPASAAPLSAAPMPAASVSAAPVPALPQPLRVSSLLGRLGPSQHALTAQAARVALGLERLAAPIGSPTHGPTSFGSRSLEENSLTNENWSTVPASPNGGHPPHAKAGSTVPPRVVPVAAVASLLSPVLALREHLERQRQAVEGERSPGALRGGREGKAGSKGAPGALALSAAALASESSASADSVSNSVWAAAAAAASASVPVSAEALARAQALFPLEEVRAAAAGRLTRLAERMVAASEMLLEPLRRTSDGRVYAACAYSLKLAELLEALLDLPFQVLLLSCFL